MSNLIKDAAAFLRDDRRRRNWAKVVQVMACVVVFVTTYALILPAITLETYTCGLAEHEHGLDCYQQITSVSEKQLSCDAEDIVDEETGEIIEVHTHSEECYTTIDVPVDFSVLTCGKADSAEHFHNDLCYGKWKLNCDKTVHIHDESCQPVSSANETEAAISTEAVTNPSEPETIPTDSTTAPTESTEEATVSTEAATESTEETTEATEETTVPTEETVPEILEQVYSDDDVIVTVTYGPEAGIPEGAQLVVETYSESYEEYYAQAQEILADETTADGENLEIAEFYLYDIHFLYEDQIIQPNEAVTVTIQFKSAVAGDPVSVIHFAEEPDVVAQTNLDENVSATFQTDSFSPYGFSLMALEEIEDAFVDILDSLPEPDSSSTLTSDDSLIAYFTFNDPTTGFQSVTTNSSGTPIIDTPDISKVTQETEFTELTLANGNFETDFHSGWTLAGYTSVVSEDPSNTSDTVLTNNTHMLQLWLSDETSSFGEASYTVRLPAGIYYFSFDLSGSEMNSGLSYTVTTKSTTLTTGGSISTTGWNTWETLKTDKFALNQTTDVTFTLSGTQPAGYFGYLDNLKLFQYIDYVDAKAVSGDNTVPPVLTNQGYRGSALDLAAGRYLQVTDHEDESLLTGYNQLTVSFWAKPRNPGAGGASWAFFANDGIHTETDSHYMACFTLNSSYMMDQMANRITETDTWTPINRLNSQDSQVTATTDWMYVTAVYTDTYMQLYVNGNLVDSYTAPAETPLAALSEILDESSVVKIGSNTTATEGFNGLIDEYRIYGTALTETEVADLYASEAIPKQDESVDYEKKLLAHFTFDDYTSGFAYKEENKDLVVTANRNNNIEVVDNAKGGRILALDGVDDYLSVTAGDSSLLTGAEEITVAYWSMFDDALTANWSFYTASEKNRGQYVGMLEGGNVHNKYRLEYNGASAGVENASNLTANTWHYITAVISKTDVRLYRNGQQIARHVFADGENYNLANLLANDSIIEIGRNPNYSNEYFKGYIDDYRIYNYALSEAEVGKLFDPKTQPELTNYENTLLAHFTFDDANGFTYTNTETNVTANAVGMKGKNGATQESPAVLGESINGSNALRLDSERYLNVLTDTNQFLLAGQEEITVAFWSKTDNTKGSWGFFASDDSTTSNPDDENYIGIKEDGNYLLEQYFDDRRTQESAPQLVAQKTDPTAWHYITAVYSGDEVTLYVDGEQRSTIKQGDDNFVGPAEILTGENCILQIGKANYGGGEFYNGYIDEFRIYGSALSRKDAADLYGAESKNTVTPTLPNATETLDEHLIAYFTFDTDEKGFSSVTTDANSNPVYGSIPGTNTAGQEILIQDAVDAEARKEGTVTLAEGYNNAADNHSVYLDGNGSYLNVVDHEGKSLLASLPNASSLNTLTVSFWTKPDKPEYDKNWCFYAAPNTDSPIYNSSENYLGVLEKEKAYIIERFETSRLHSTNPLSEDLPVTTPQVTDEWQYVTAVFDEYGIALYINGEFIDRKTPAEGVVNIADMLGLGSPDSPSILQIGKANWAGGEFYQGHLDEYRIYDIALTSSQIADLYRQEAGPAAEDVPTVAAPTDLGSVSNLPHFVLYTEIDGNSYALTSPIDDKLLGVAPVTMNEDGTISLGDATNLFWTFSKNGNVQDSYFIQNTVSKRHIHAFDNSNGTTIDLGTATSGKNPSSFTKLEDGSYIIQGGENKATEARDDYLYIGYRTNEDGSIEFIPVDTEANAVKFKLAKTHYYVWLDGTCGDLMAYYGSDDTVEQFLVGQTNEITLPQNWNSPSKYIYKLRGWYDITNSTYYKPGDKVTVTGDTVFYADWEPLHYNFGVNNKYVSNTLDTSDFIEIHMFDYNPLFNAPSLQQTGTISATDHSETWSMDADYSTDAPLGFIFRDYDLYNKDISRPLNAGNINEDGEVDRGIVGGYNSSIADAPILNTLFGIPTDDSDWIIGKNYVGPANHLFQFVDPADPLYQKSENAGYYYYDSKYNAASYSAEDERFYVYNYRERTTDSRGSESESAVYASEHLSSYSDFLPFNSPYASTINNGKAVNTYTIPGATYFENTHYQYDAKNINRDGGQGNSVDHVIANYNYGMMIDINFYLPNAAGETDGFGNLGNLSTTGAPMEFGFEGDDDLWVFVDGKLVLDVGGIHGVRTGSINFSTGEVTTSLNGGTETKVHDITNQIGEGAHTLTVYYLERGSSQSNCAIYFNLSPRYGLDLTKVDYLDNQKTLAGAEFEVYTDEACTNLAPLWKSEDDARSKDSANLVQASFTTGDDGNIHLWGLIPGHTYYMKEVKAPNPAAGETKYPTPDDLICVTVSNLGIATSNVSVLPQGDRDEGFEILSNTLDHTKLEVGLVLSNMQEGIDTTKVRVNKVWAEGSPENPDPITVYLHAEKDGTKVEEGFPKKEVLNAGNNWSHTWVGLDDSLTYFVTEDVPEGFISSISEPHHGNEDELHWTTVGSLEPGATYLLTHDDQALVWDGTTLKWEALDTAKNKDSAWWTAHATGSGFRLTTMVENTEYALTLTESESNYSFTVEAVDSSLNQILNYSGSKIFAMAKNTRYELATADNPSAATANGLPFAVMRQDVEDTTVQYITVTNTPMTYELPESGGRGTVLYTVSGLAILAAAAFLELNRRRRYV